MAKIKIKEMKCPCCGAALELTDKGYGETKCSYCNAIVFISREDTNDGMLNITNKKDGKPIATISIPLGWDVTNTFVNYNKSTLELPYSVGFDLENNMGSTIHIETGNSYNTQGAVLYVNKQLPHTIQRDFFDVHQFIEEFVQSYAKIENTSYKYIEDLDIPIEGYDKKEDFERTKAYYEEKNQCECTTTGASANIIGFYSECACKSYEVGDKVMIVFTKLHGYQRRINLMGLGNITDGISNLVSGIGNLFNKQKENKPNTKNQNKSIMAKMADKGLLGGMLGKKYKTQTEEVVEEPLEPPVTEEPVEEDPTPVNEFLIGKLDHPGQGELLEFQTDPLFVLLSNKKDYKKIYAKAYKQVCSSFMLSPEVVNDYRNMKQQWEQEINAANQREAQMQYQNGQNLIRLGQQRMAANYSYIDSMRARSNQQFESQRNAYNSRMDAQDRMRDQRTEAILGVNTYIKPDGHEVEVPVSADTAWINGKGEIIGGSAGFDPGSDWTQLDRKY